jgi:hypothetical protein
MLELLFIKHFIADFVIQDNETAIAKRRYRFLSHSFHHAVLTFWILFFFTTPNVAFLLATLDFIAHHHIDYIKSRLSEKITPADRKYWIYLGADQLLHYLTYLAIFGLTQI